MARQDRTSEEAHGQDMDVHVFKSVKLQAEIKNSKSQKIETSKTFQFRIISGAEFRTPKVLDVAS